MIAQIIIMLIYVALLVGVIYLVFWVLNHLGISLPPQIVNIVWVIVALLVLLWFVQAFLGGGFTLPSPVPAQ